MSNFGTGEPKFVGTGDPDSATVLLPGGELIEENWFVPDVIEQRAPASGFRHFLQGGDEPTGGSQYSEFLVMVKLFDTTKYATSLAQKTKIIEIMKYNQKHVYFYPHTSTGVKNYAGSLVRCFMDVTSGTHSANGKFDMLYLRIKSEHYTYPVNSLV